MQPAAAAGQREVRRTGTHDVDLVPGERHVDVGGSVDQWVEELTGAVLGHGASGFMLFAADHGTPARTVLGRWAQEIVPAVREAVAKETG